MPKPIVDSPPLLDEFAQVSLYIQHCKCIHSVEQLCVCLEPMLLCNAFFVYNTPPMLVHIPWRSDPKSTPSVTSSSYEHHHGWLPPLVIVRALVTCSTSSLTFFDALSISASIAAVNIEHQEYVFLNQGMVNILIIHLPMQSPNPCSCDDSVLSLLVSSKAQNLLPSLYLVLQFLLYRIDPNYPLAIESYHLQWHQRH